MSNRELPGSMLQTVLPQPKTLNDLNRSNSRNSETSGSEIPRVLLGFSDHFEPLIEMLYVNRQSNRMSSVSRSEYSMWIANDTIGRLSENEEPADKSSEEEML